MAGPTMNHRSGSRNYKRVFHKQKKGYKRMDETIDVVYLNKGTDEELECHGYRENPCRTIWYYVVSVFSLGSFVLVMHWRPDWAVKFRKIRCPLSRADTVLIKDCYGVLFVASVETTQLDDGPPSDFVFESYHRDTSESEDDTTSLTLKQKHIVRYFDHQHVRYIWDDNIKSFKKLVGLDQGVKCSAFHEFTGVIPSEQRQRLKIYGENNIHVEVKSYWQLFSQEVINPFYIFQIFSVILWMMDDYYYYAACIVLISAVSMGVSLYETKKQSVTLSEMVGTMASTVTVCRGESDYEEVPTTQLVPGDVIVIPARGCLMQCDAVLVSGNAIVNESMLTGESVPVTKTPLVHSEDHETLSPDEHKRHIIFSGTQVIQTRYYGNQKVQAVVLRTGFSTAKGELVRAILFPKPMDFRFYQDSIRFILVLAGIASIGMTYSTAIMALNKASVSKIILRALDIITIVVPPALPAAMTVGTVYAQSRLKKQGIFCISPPRINMCGKLKLICFDKTGTLTEDGLDMWGVVPLQDGGFLPVNQNPSDLPVRGPFLASMATCHSLTRIDGELTGDPLDLKMFESTNWTIEEPGLDITRFDSLMPTVVRPPTMETLMPYVENRIVPLIPDLGMDRVEDIFSNSLEEPGKDTSKFDILVPTIVKPCTKDTYFSDKDETPYEIGIVRQFPFSSSLQRMSVITRTLGSTHMNLHAKGAPEKIASLCKKQTLPEDFHDVLQRYTMQGFRVIAVAYKQLDSKITWHQVQRISRDKVENELNFLGLIIMQNTLKPQTTPVIHTLLTAKIRTVMVTGDNMLTAVSVARDCGMVQPKEKVIMVNAHPPESGKPAWIDWEHAETDAKEEETELNTASPNSYQAIDIGEDQHKFHFAVTGRSFAVIRKHFADLLPRICLRGTVFARMGPDQKAQLIEHLQELGYCVGMCGDGANDCGALKMAHAGISLSEAEASVASPFTSKTPNIECVPTVIKEGRAALVTSFGVFKYVALYSMIQFISVLILYTLKTNLGDFMFLYVDLVLVTLLLILMGNIGAYEHLVPQRPPGSLLSVGNLFSIFTQIFTAAMFQAGVIFYLRSQPWFSDKSADRSGDGEVVMTLETTVIFSISAFQYITTAFVFSRGPPYRKPVYTNLTFLVSLIVLTIFTAYLVIYPAAPLANFFKLQQISPVMFKVVLVGLAVINFVFSLSIEFLVNSGFVTRIFKKICKKKHPKNRYKLIEQDLQDNPDWPPVGQVTTAKVPMDFHNGHLGVMENSVVDLQGK